MYNRDIERLDEELKRLLTESSDLKTLLCKLSSHILKLLSILYGDSNIEGFFKDVSRSREYILAIYVCIALSVDKGIVNVDALPEDIIRELVSRLLILYEKCKHIKKMLEEG